MTARSNSRNLLPYRHEENRERTVMNTVTSALSGKMATVDSEALTDKGRTFAGGECVVKVP